MGSNSSFIRALKMLIAESSDDETVIEQAKMNWQNSMIIIVFPAQLSIEYKIVKPYKAFTREWISIY